MRLLLNISFFLFLFSNCKTNYDDLANGIYRGDKLVVYGVVDNENGLVVKVSHSVQPIGKTTDNLNIIDAHIILYENGDSLPLIIKGRKINGLGGYEYTDSTIHPKVGARYKIIVSTIGYQTVESEEQVFLEKPDVRNISALIGKGEIYGDKFYIFKANLFFDSTHTYYYVINTVTESDTSAATTNYTTNLDSKYKTCDAYLYSLIFFYGSSNCFYSGEEILWNIGFNKNFNLFTKKTPSSLNLRISSVSKIFFDYGKSLNQPDSPQDLIFREPNAAVNNIKNGYGYFYTKNTFLFTKKI